MNQLKKYPRYVPTPRRKRASNLAARGLKAAGYGLGWRLTEPICREPWGFLRGCSVWEVMIAFYQTKGTASLMIIMGLLVILLPMPGIVAGAKDSLWFSVVVGLLVVLYAGWFVFRLARVGVHVSKEGIRVVNPIRTRAIPWSSIRSFSWGRYGLWPKVGAELNDGTSARSSVCWLEGPGLVHQRRLSSINSTGI